jgi:hypothetical protein
MEEMPAPYVLSGVQRVKLSIGVGAFKFPPGVYLWSFL